MDIMEVLKQSLDAADVNAGRKLQCIRPLSSYDSNLLNQLRGTGNYTFRCHYAGKIITLRNRSTGIIPLRFRVIGADGWPR